MGEPPDYNGEYEIIELSSWSYSDYVYDDEPKILNEGVTYSGRYIYTLPRMISKNCFTDSGTNFGRYMYIIPIMASQNISLNDSVTNFGRYIYRRPTMASQRHTCLTVSLRLMIVADHYAQYMNIPISISVLYIHRKNALGYLCNTAPVF